MAVVFALPFVGAFAEQAPVIEIVTTFDYPAPDLSTIPEGINDNGEIVGRLKDSIGRVRGFFRSRDGRFSPPIIEPNGFGDFFTDIRGINNSRLVCGFYLETDNFLHGFFATHAGFTQFDIPGAVWTEVDGVNDAGDFCGAFSNNVTAAHFQPFVSVSGMTGKIRVPEATTSFANGINNSNEIVGEYVDTSSILHGFFRDAAGTLTAPIDPPGAISTTLFGLNDQGVIVGRFTDGSGMQRGFVLLLSDTVLVLDIPGATLTSLNGINNHNIMCGRFEDDAGVAHGIVARLSNGLSD